MSIEQCLKMKQKLLKLAHHPLTYKMPSFNFCFAMGKSQYVSTLLKTYTETAKIIHNETFKENDRSFTMQVWFGFVISIFNFLQLSKIFGKAPSICKNEISWTFILNSLFLHYLQLDRKSIKNGKQVCILHSSDNYCYDVLFLLITGNTLTYLLTCLVAGLFSFFFTYLLTNY